MPVPGDTTKIDRRRSIEGEKGKKKRRGKEERRRGEEERSPSRRPRSRIVAAHGSPTSRRRPRPRAIFLLHVETERLPAGRKIEATDKSTGRKAFHGNMRQSRHLQSLHSVYSTLNSQLAAAEQLSDSLSRQMTLLNINNPTKRVGVTRELFESIGLADEGITLKSPDVRSPFHSPDSVKRIISADFSSKDYPRRAASSALSTTEPETTRRRGDSLQKRLVEGPGGTLQ
ncbi:hypothetical protein BHM03_00039020 [Ensete ventricosum]|nr:hypothetical protein BHM03_00039020 [Ensete ventricosum]